MFGSIKRRVMNDAVLLYIIVVQSSIEGLTFHLENWSAKILFFLFSFFFVSFWGEGRVGELLRKSFNVELRSYIE